MARLNMFQNFPVANNIADPGGIGLGVPDTRLQMVEIPGSISFNTVAILIRASSAINHSITLSFGLYSMNGASLSLANSASQSTNINNDSTIWITLATSATQDITPGTWYFGIQMATGGNSRVGLFGIAANANFNDSNMGGFPFRGSASGSIPSVIASSNIAAEGGSGGKFHMPYIIISA